MSARTWMAVAAVAMLAAGCGSSDKSSDSGGDAGTGSGAGSTPSAAATATASVVAAKAEIKQAYVNFFSGKTGAKTKIGLVEHGGQFAPVIEKQAGGSLSKGTSVTVSRVIVNSLVAGTVTYTVSLAGVPALKDQTGQAVKEGGRWKVAAPTFCSLLQLEGAAPALCKKS